MRRALALLAPAILSLCLLAAAPGQAAESDATDLDLHCLETAYPGAVAVSRGPGGVTLRLPGGQRLPYDDGTTKNAAEALRNPSVKDMMEQIYPLGTDGREPEADFDPGRRRVTAFFTALYGASKAEVMANAVSVDFAGKRVLFSSLYGAAAALRDAGRDLAALIQTRPDLKKYLFPVSTIAWRAIAGVDRLSMHALGIAVDLNPRLGPYWGWSAPGTPSPAKSYPMEIVDIFERHGFIWGGKWREFDLMHFEYRPELLCKSRRLRGE
jgi:hypothetical protein